MNPILKASDIKFRFFFLLYCYLFYSWIVFADVNNYQSDKSYIPSTDSAASISLFEEMGHFTGRISKLSTETSLIRFRVQFRNLKFLNKNEYLEIWSEGDTFRCAGQIVGKSNQHLLVKVVEMQKCLDRTQLAVGAHIHLFSKVLAKNVNLAKEVVEILLKKKFAIQIKIDKRKQTLDQYLDKIEVVNKRYDILKAKLEQERQEEISALQSDKLTATNSYNSLKGELMEVEHKLEEYSVGQSNLSQDRWALDAALYLKK